MTSFLKPQFLINWVGMGANIFYYKGLLVFLRGILCHLPYVISKPDRAMYWCLKQMVEIVKTSTFQNQNLTFELLHRHIFKHLPMII